MMEELAFSGYLCGCVLIPMLLVYGILRAVRKKRGFAEPRGYFPKLLVFAVYIAGVFYFTGAGTLKNIGQYGMGPEVTRFNAVPFSASSFDVTAYLLNVVLLLPLGFLLPLIWPAYNRFFRVAAYGAGFSLLIELSQLVNIRSTDIDDLLLNTLGAAAGFLLFRLFARVSRRKEITKSGRGYEAVLYTAAMFTGYFLFYNEIGLAKWMYGF